MRRQLLAASLLIVAAAAALAAQEPFRSRVDLVALNLAATDAKEQFVPALGQTDFAVFEDGVRQDVAFFAATRVPIDLVLLLDTSASMSDKIGTVQQAAIGFAGTLGEGDRVGIIDIKDGTKVLYPLSSDIAGAKRAILTTEARGGTGLYTGMYLSLKELLKERRATADVRRQAMVVLSDGQDTSSLVSFDDVMQLAKETGVAVYTITLKSKWMVREAQQSGRRDYAPTEYSMRAIAQETGARWFFPLDVLELTGVYSLIAAELAHQYTVGYVSSNARADGAFRRIQVRIADRANVRVRTRTGYLAPRS